MVRIAILDDYQDVAMKSADWSVLPPDSIMTSFRDRLGYGAELVGRLAPFAVIGAMRERTPFPRALLEQLPNLRLLVTTGMRNSAIDLEAAREFGVTVSGTNSPGHATVELTMALMLSLARGLPTETASMQRGGWPVGVGRDLKGATLGVIGVGRVGAEVARLGQAFGMDVIAWSENLTAERCEEVGAQLSDRDGLFRRSDFVTIHLKLSERTHGLIGESILSLMKHDAYLINTSRGPIVDEGALIHALERQSIGGAALDVYDQEPLPADHPLRRAPRLLLTPHIGYVTSQTYEIFYSEMVESIAAFLRGSPIRVL
ncbi:MAG: D-2-hydroxyacid dehydrogenase family protein [Acidimicrobiia bacterium]|nr:D-2-hydroxyacid dehydrogenase family protein [Acidimicrobiia bacterium]